MMMMMMMMMMNRITSLTRSDNRNSHTCHQQILLSSSMQTNEQTNAYNVQGRI